MIRRFTGSVRQRYFRTISAARAKKVVKVIVETPGGPYSGPPPDGYIRGIDFYEKRRLTSTIANVIGWYRCVGGRFPDLISPATFSEKINHAKFFAVMKVPETGNKSLTATFIPDHLTGMVRYPTVTWRSPTATLPDNDEIAPGVYYLKTNHGSAMVSRVVYPLSQADRAGIERKFAKFLRADYGLDMGEWWYSSFPRELILEEAVSRQDPPITLLFYVFGGNVGLVCADRKFIDRTGTTQTLLLDGDFNPLAVQKPDPERLRDFHIAPELKAQTLHIAREIGGRFASIRVDLFIGDDGGIYLNELTQTSGCGAPFYDQRLDAKLGGMWVGQEIYITTEAQ